MAKNLLRSVVSRRVVALVALVAVVAACAPDRNEQMYNLNGLVFEMSLDNFIWTRDNATGYWSYMNWESNQCSVVGNGPWDFGRPCMRHDFSYRNLKRISNDFWAEPSVWNGRNKDAADWRFLGDMFTRCGEHGWWYSWACYPVADLYFSIVNVIPPLAAPWEAGQNSFAW